MWKTVKLGDICFIQSGNSIAAKKKTELFTNVIGTPYVATKDVGFDGNINYKNGIYIPQEYVNSFKISQSGSTLVCAEGGSAGRKIAFSMDDCCFVNKLYSITPNESLESKYIYYYTLSEEFQSQFKAALHGLIGGVSLKKFKEFAITIPPLAEQQRIVAKLDAVFDKTNRIAEDNKKKLEAYKKLTYKIISKILKKFQSQDSLNTKLEDVTYTAGRIGWKGLSKKEYVDQGYIFLSVHGLNYGKYVDFRDAFRITKTRYEESPEIMLKQGDVLLCKDGAGIGKLAIVNNLKEPATINSSILLIRPNENLCSEYLYYYLRASEFQSLIYEKIDGATTPHLYQRDIKNLPISFPSNDLQKKAVLEIEAALQQVEMLQSVCSKNISNYLALKEVTLAKELHPSEAA